MSSSPTGDAEALGGLMRKGLAWSFLNTVLGRFGTVLVGIAIARILTREDFGVFAIALVVLSATLSINELGVSVAILRWQKDVDSIQPTVATLSVVTSGVLYLVCFLGAPAFTRLMGDEAATGVVRLLCVGVLVDAVSAVPAARLIRDFRQRTRFVIDTTNFVVSTVVTLSLALAGAGAWSLAWGRLSANLVSAALLVAWAPGHWRLGFDRGRARELLRFGLPLAGSNLLVVGMVNIDKVVTGHTLGTVLLGTYALAFNLSSWPVNVLSVTVQPVAIPGFARLLDDLPRLREAFTRGVTSLLVATLLVSVPLAVLAEPAIRFLYGVKWVDAAPALTGLAVFGASRVMVSLLYDLMVAAGRTRQALAVQVAWFATLFPALVVGARLDGIRGVAWAQAVVSVLVVLPLSWWVVRGVGLRGRDLARPLVRPLLGGVVLVAVCLAVLATGLPDLATLALAGVVGGAAYVGVTWPTWAVLLGEVRRSRGRRPVEAT
ncbi:MAG: lipopolysaccharide biosynthesis protein [Micrococcales bacterium]|nr:lipopolysaccharide biosynthesis protein [Micrococcales bacterium]